MKSPLQITVRDMPASAAFEQHIREKFQKLEQMFANIISCQVVVELPHRHHHQGKQFDVRINLSVPGHDIVVNHEHHEDPYVAFRDAFNAASRQLEDFVRRLRDARTRSAIGIGDLAEA